MVLVWGVLMHKIKIILADWDQYPLARLKEIGSRKFECGILPFLENISKYSCDVVDVILVINSDNADCIEKYKFISSKFNFISKIHIRNNYAMDIGAYDYGYQACIQEGYTGRIIFVNSSVSGPHTENWLIKYEELFLHTNKIGLSGATVNMIPIKINNFLEFREEHTSSKEHVQSWFLYTDMNILKKCFGNSLLLDGLSYTDKNGIIENGEIGISQRILDNGYGINCMAFPKLHYFKGEAWPYPFKFGWRVNNKELLRFLNTTIV